MSKTWLFYIQHLLVALISTFGSLACVPVGITSSAVGLKICAITAGIKKSIIKKKKKNHDEIVLLVKDKLNTVSFLIRKQDQE